MAALLVLFSGDSTGRMRLAVLLAVIAVALIGASLALRRDPDSMRDQIEDTLFEELDVLRDDVREDITTAARATHKAFGERVVTLQDSVESLRGEVETLRVRVERGGVPAQPVAPPVAPTPVPHPPMAPPPGVGRPHPVVPSHGVVRHTETVKVTTRQTIVDQNDGGHTTGTVYGAGNRPAQQPAVPTQRRPERTPAPPRGDDADDAESWTGQLLRERLADQRRGGERHDGARYGESRYGDDRSGQEGWTGDGRRRAMEPEDDHSGHISGVQAGDRWASVRSDDHGREVRMGERRTAMHTDESGTELRVEDRWAAVRRDEVRRPEPRHEPERQPDRGREPDADWSSQPQRDRATRPDGFQSEPRFGESRGDDNASWSPPPRDRRGTPAALPAAPSEPSASSWMQGWDSQPEPVRRSRPPGDDDGYGRDEEAAPARSARARSAGHDTGQERWR